MHAIRNFVILFGFFALSSLFLVASKIKFRFFFFSFEVNGDRLKKSIYLKIVNPKCNTISALKKKPPVTCFVLKIRLFETKQIISNKKKPQYFNYDFHKEEKTKKKKM